MRLSSVARSRLHSNPVAQDDGARRRFIAMASSGLAQALLMTPRDASAQQRIGIARVGLLQFGSAAPASEAPSTQAQTGTWLLLGLRELGYVEGQNIHIERRNAEGRLERLAAQAAELVSLKVDVILALGPAARNAAAKATSSIPIVTVSGNDPVEEGWAQSLARPGGNITGMTVNFPELGAKRLEILKQALPATVRVAVLADSPAAVGVWQHTEDGARRLGLQLQRIEVRSADGLEAAFSQARQQQAQAMSVSAGSLFVSQRGRIAALAISHRMPTISLFPWMAQAGILMTYGSDVDDLHRRALTQMDKILKGARAGELPIERPTKFLLIVNRKTAKALGITLPQSLLLRADEVID